jgi:hypothetical protein
MLDTYIKNRGSTKTIIHNNNHNKISEANWDVDYDGNVANLSLDLNNNGKSKHYNLKLDNSDLAKILNMDSIHLPIDQRLKRDFKKVHVSRNPISYDIYLDNNLGNLDNKLFFEEPSVSSSISQEIPSLSINDLLKTKTDNLTHISSPEEELFIPLTIDKKNVTPRKYHRRPRTHKTYRVYKALVNSKAKGKKTKSHKKSKNNSKTSKTIKQNSLQEYFNI